MQLQYEIMPADHLEMVRTARSGSPRRIIGLVLDGFVLLCGILLQLLRPDEPWGAVFIACAILIFFLHFAGPYIAHRRIYSRNPRVYGRRTVNFDEQGIRSDTPLGHNEAPWSSFEMFRETKNLFLLYQTKDYAGIV
ncbi:MAG TPA: YcxB family protein, partial [Alphaproteobacteria bacterium]|nr:YcxB family protein [Alphaproteobacteria bacterium]